VLINFLLLLAVVFMCDVDVTVSGHHQCYQHDHLVVSMDLPFNPLDVDDGSKSVLDFLHDGVAASLQQV
jgi:hypothetical protein